MWNTLVFACFCKLNSEQNYILKLSRSTLLCVLKTNWYIQLLFHFTISSNQDKLIINNGLSFGNIFIFLLDTMNVIIRCQIGYHVAVIM